MKVVKVRVFHGNKELGPEEDGFLCEFKKPPRKQTLTLEIEKPREEGFFLPFKVKTRFPSKEIFLELLRPDNPERHTYKKEIFIHKTEEGINENGLPVTKWPKNHIKVVTLKKEGKGGELMFRLWEPGVVSQITDDGVSRFFIVKQMAHESPVRRNKFGKIILPRWPEANAWLTLWNNIEIFIDKKELPLYEDSSRKNDCAQNLNPAEYEENIGMVLWYNLAYQIGAIQMKDISRRVHWTQIQSSNRFKSLTEGQRVRVKKTQSAINAFLPPRITDFEEDALGVEVV